MKRDSTEKCKRTEIRHQRSRESVDNRNSEPTGRSSTEISERWQLGSRGWSDSILKIRGSIYMPKSFNGPLRESFNLRLEGEHRYAEELQSSNCGRVSNVDCRGASIVEMQKCLTIAPVFELSCHPSKPELDVTHCDVKITQP
jgi:hypothetical protein